MLCRLLRPEVCLCSYPRCLRQGLYIVLVCAFLLSERNQNLVSVHSSDVFLSLSSAPQPISIYHTTPWTDRFQTSSCYVTVAKMAMELIIPSVRVELIYICYLVSIGSHFYNRVSQLCLKYKTNAFQHLINNPRVNWLIQNHAAKFIYRRITFTWNSLFSFREKVRPTLTMVFIFLNQARLNIIF